MEAVNPPTIPLILSTLFLFSHLLHLSLSSSVTLQHYDRRVLLRIQKHFGGQKSRFWNSSSTECCTYCFDKPVRCDEDGHVVGLSLESDPQNLFGDIPAAVADLTFLVDLFITGPYFTGPIPPAIGGKLSNVQSLSIVNTSMTGPIPGSLGRLRNLTRLNLMSNKFTGHLPKSLSHLTNLWELDLTSNQLSGSIPDDFFTHTMSSKLIILHLRSNRFSGTIPTTIGRLVNIQSLDLSDNQLSGLIPMSVSRLVNLQSLDLSENQLGGQIPNCFSSFKDPIKLRLSNNRLTGSIPKSLGEARLWTIDLSRNRITDASYLLHRTTRFSGLRTIDLSKNALRFDFSNAKLPNNINELNISHNMIYGSMPKRLGHLPNLVSLDVSYNQLCGQIPKSQVLERFSPVYFAHNKCLCGSPLSPCK